MKMKIAIIALAALSFASCNKNDEFKENSNFPTDGVIRVATSVDGHKTRAGMTTENISMFNIKITNAANSAYSYYGFYHKLDDVWNCYVADESLTTPLTMLWQNSTQVVTVSALSVSGVLYPKDEYEANWGHSILVNQSEESYLKTNDYLYMAPTVINPATDLVNGKLPITFKHIMSKVHLTVTLGTELNTTPGTTTNPITDITISGTVTAFTWNASTNSGFTLSPWDNDITPWHNAAAYTAGNGTTTKAVAKYEVILVPQTVAANGFSVSFKIAGKDYTWTSPTAITLEKGTLYELNLTAGKDIVNLGSLTASEWGAGTGGNIETR